MRYDRGEREKLDELIRELSHDYQIVTIGGLAVLMYGDRGTLGGETTFDVDFYISLADYAELRDREEVVPNARLRKAQIVRDGIECDVYVERQHGLAVPYDEIARFATIIDGVRLAAPEHLLVLKTDAALDRVGSRKGEKDERDIVRIMAHLGSPNESILAPYLTSRRQQLLTQIAERAEPFITLADGNRHHAAELRRAYNSHLRGVLGRSPENEEKHNHGRSR